MAQGCNLVLKMHDAREDAWVLLRVPGSMPSIGSHLQLQPLETSGDSSDSWTPVTHIGDIIR